MNANRSTASHFEDLLSCGICLDIYDQPRKLPMCPHIFCSKCLQKLLTVQGQGGVIHCPKCRLNNEIPVGGVGSLHKDLVVQEMVESFLCVDCKTIDRFAKMCDICQVKLCHVCACSHDSKEKCNLLRSIRELKSKLALVSQEEKLSSQESDLQAFIQENSEQRAEVDKQMKSLITSLEERRIQLLNKFEEYDQLAKEHLQSFDQVKNIARSIEDFKNTVAQMTTEQVTSALGMVDRQKKTVKKATDALSTLVPDPLGTLYISRLERDLKYLGDQILRRRAGEDCESEEIWIGVGCLQEITMSNFRQADDVDNDPDYGVQTDQQKNRLLLFDDVYTFCSVKDVEMSDDEEYLEIDDGEDTNIGWKNGFENLKAKIVRHRGGRYEVWIMDSNNDVLKKVEWNNHDEDFWRKWITVHQYHNHITWDVGRGPEHLREFSFASSDSDLMCTLMNVLEHASFVDSPERNAE